MAAAEAVEFFQSLAPGEPKPGEGTPGYKSDPLAYSLSRIPMRTPRQLTIICAGAGFSGLSLANDVETGNIKNCNLKIYEKNSNVGGTWFENRYPGCACDIPIHNYQFSWAPYPYFPSFYAEGKYILEYLEEVADQRSLRKYVRTSHKVIGAKWIEEKKKWQVKLIRTDGRELAVSDSQTHDDERGEPFIEECDVFINATGAFNNWRWPSIPNRTVFQGDMYHSAAWPRGSSLKGRTVALIGNGSTGIQLLPAILNEVDKVYVFIRNRTWVTAGLAQRYAGPNGTNKFFTEEEMKNWADDPGAYLKYRKEIEDELNARFRLYINNSDTQRAARDFSIKQMTEKLAGKPELASMLIPDFPVGCRRPTPGNGYLEALCSHKVEIVWGEIETFTEKGLKPVGGGARKVDSIICATGFNMGFAPRFPIVGRNGIDLRHEWTTKPPACYLSLSAEDMPNYFVYMGPSSPLGHGSIVGSIERVTEYIRKFLYKLQTENYGSFTLKQNVADAWQSHALKWMEKTVWNASCVSTFKNGTKDGRIISLHPGSRLHYFDLLENPRFEDYEWESLCNGMDNMFAWLADGFTDYETNGGNDLSYYTSDAPHLLQRGQTGNGVANGHTARSGYLRVYS